MCEDIAARQKFGFSKYGTTLWGASLPPLRLVRHAYEESLDKSIYLRALMDTIEKLGLTEVFESRTEVELLAALQRRLEDDRAQA